MAAINFTPISLYYTTTAAAVPSAGNLVAGELALNTTDEKLYFKNAAGVVKLLASNAATTTGVTSFQTSLSGLTPSTSTTGAVTLAGTLGTANGGTNLTSFTSGGVVYASSTSALATGSALTFDGSTLALTGVQQITNPSSGSTLILDRTSNAGSLQLNYNGTQTGQVQAASGGGLIFYQGSTPTEGMRLTSTGLGIGQNSPGAKLHVSTSSAGGVYGAIIYNTSATGQGLTVRAGSTSSEDTFNCQTYDGGISLFTVKANGVISDSAGNLRAIPQSGSSKTSSYTLATTDVGEYILLGASGAIVIPDATFSTGDVVSIFNNTASTATITCTITTAYIAGTFTDKATMTLAAAGVATILFITGTTCVVSGNVT
tara:strand:- start:2557 stop:3675 length:1119 start_codon:yes stop_codon:yes gene_type:complete